MAFPISEHSQSSHPARAHFYPASQPLAALLHTRSQRALPGSWVTLLVHMPCSWTPAVSVCQASRHPGAAPASGTTKAPAISSDFEALSHGFCIRCLRFTLWSPSRARLAPGWLPTFAGQDFHLLGYVRKFQCRRYIFPPSRLTWRQPDPDMEISTIRLLRQYDSLSRTPYLD